MGYKTGFEKRHVSHPLGPGILVRVTIFLVFLVSGVSQIKAQKGSPTLHEDSTEIQADRILNDPGLPTFDPDDTWEYLDGIPDISATGMELLHANPNVSWILAHRTTRNWVDERSSTMLPDSNALGTIAPNRGRFSIRSRVSETFDPYLQQGYISHQYLGSPEAVYNRIDAQSGEIGVSALEEKLAWEPSFTDRLYGFAYLRRPVGVTNSLSLKQAVAGNYSLAFGNGMIFGGGVSGSKTFAAANAVEQRSFGMRGTIGNGAKSLEGAAVELSSGPANLMIFASDRKIGAKIDSAGTIQTLYQNATRQTQSELALEGAASSSVVGARAEIETNDTASLFLKGGATSYELRYNHPLTKTAGQLFTGTKLGMAGVDALAIGNNFSAAVDAAISAHDSVRNAAALSVSCLFEADSNVGMSLMYRHIPNSFVSPFGEVSGSAISSLSNSDGFYAGAQMTAFQKRLRISAYADIENEVAAIGDVFEKQKNDYLASVRFKATNALELSATIRDNWNSNPPQDSTLSGSQNAYGQTMNIRLEAEYNPRQTGTIDPVTASLETRYEYVRNISTSIKTGWLALEEVRTKIKPIQSELVVSVARFETDSYNSAVWLYEPGLWGTGTSNALDIKGWRASTRAIIHALKKLACSFILSGSFYDNPRTIGSGLSAHAGSSDVSAAIQFDLRI